MTQPLGPVPACGVVDPEMDAGEPVDDGFEPLHAQDARNPLHPVEPGVLLSGEVTSDGVDSGPVSDQPA